MAGVTSGTTDGPRPGVIGWLFRFLGNLFRDFIAFVVHVVNLAVHAIFGTGSGPAGTSGWWLP